MTAFSFYDQFIHPPSDFFGDELKFRLLCLWHCVRERENEMRERERN